MPTNTNYTAPIRLTDNEQRAKNTIITFWILIGITLIALVSGYMQLELLERMNAGGNYTDEQLDSNDLRQDIIYISQKVVTLILAFLFIMWFRRSYVNAGRISDLRLNHEDSWAIWSFVIPIISWWYPYTMATEIDEKMNRFLNLTKPGYLPAAIGWFIGIWWAFFILRNIANLILNYIEEETIDELIVATRAFLIADVLDILAALVTIMMIIKMSEKEKEVKITVHKINTDNALMASNQKLLEEE